MRRNIGLLILAGLILVVNIGCNAPQPIIESLTITIDEPTGGPDYTDYALPLGERMMVRAHFKYISRAWEMHDNVAERSEKDRYDEAQIEFTFYSRLYDLDHKIISQDSCRVGRGQESPVKMLLAVPGKPGPYILEVACVATEPSGAKTRWVKTASLR